MVLEDRSAERMLSSEQRRKTPVLVQQHHDVGALPYLFEDVPGQPLIVDDEADDLGILHDAPTLGTTASQRPFLLQLPVEHHVSARRGQQYQQVDPREQ
ncbi:hypothetical protein ASE90_00060 [Sphingomonas sp. Leaf67]|nr:hypothetical protein ASE90_00060 [Sphingomonas sp. Leaf67]